MEGFVKGDVVVLPWPFSDLSEIKRRPALVVSNVKGDDLILCQITSRKKRSDYSVDLDKSDFEKGSLSVNSVVKLNRIFTADKKIVSYLAGSLNKGKIKDVEEEIVNIFRV